MTNCTATIPEPILATRRVDPGKVEKLREYVESLDDWCALFVKGLETGNMHAEAASLRQDDGPVLYYYMEPSEDYPADIEPEDIDDDVLELSEEHESVLDDVCVESARDEDGQLHALETLFFASSLDRDE